MRAHLQVTLAIGKFGRLGRLSNHEGGIESWMAGAASGFLLSVKKMSSRLTWNECEVGRLWAAWEGQGVHGVYRSAVARAWGLLSPE